MEEIGQEAVGTSEGHGDIAEVVGTGEGKRRWRMMWGLVQLMGAGVRDPWRWWRHSGSHQPRPTENCGGTFVT